MKIFHYHPETGVYLAEGLADPSPLEPGTWLIPAHATSDIPPCPAEGEQAVRINDDWRVQPIPDPTPEPEQKIEIEPQLQLETQTEVSELTTLEKLALIGLTVEDLRALLSES